MKEEKLLNKKKEDQIIKLIKKACRCSNLKPEDWKKYAPKVI